MYKNKFLSHIVLLLLVFSILAPLPVTQAASSFDNVLATLASSTVSGQNNAATSPNQNPFQKLVDLLLNNILKPILNVFSSKSPTTSATLAASATGGHSQTTTSGLLQGKVIVIDPGHGGSNPGAVANNTRESDNNLAVGLKVRNQLVQAGAKVIMTRDTDRTVAPEGSSLGSELEARLKLAETNHADIFVSIHSNENPDTAVTGAMTFYPSGKSSTLATTVENSIIPATNAVNKGTEPATFYVLRNAAMPSTLIEMGFVSNSDEASLLNSDVYRNKMALGIVNGIIKYFNN